MCLRKLRYFIVVFPYIRKLVHVNTRARNKGEDFPR